MIKFALSLKLMQIGWIIMVLSIVGIIFGIVLAILTWSSLGYFGHIVLGSLVTGFIVFWGGNLLYPI